MPRSDRGRDAATPAEGPMHRIWRDSASGHWHDTCASVLERGVLRITTVLLHGRNE